MMNVRPNFNPFLHVSPSRRPCPSSLSSPNPHSSPAPFIPPPTGHRTHSETFPTAGIDLPFQLPRHHARHRPAQPRLPQDLVVAPLVEEQLQVAAQRRVDLAELVQVRRDGPAAGFLMQVQDAALADVQEEARQVAASGWDFSLARPVLL